MRSALTLTETIEMFRQVAHDLIRSQDALTQADRAIGDGDHGVGMARGCEALLGSLETGAYTDLKGLFGAAGKALMTSMGGASGIIFSAWFIAGGKSLADQTAFDAAAVIAFLRDGIAAVQVRGKAKPGDKTMLDALFPALQAAEESEQQGLLAVIEAAAKAADQGAECTKNMQASIGRAKTLGPRALGFIDPGALSTSLILNSMAQYVRNLPY